MRVRERHLRRGCANTGSSSREQRQDTRVRYSSSPRRRGIQYKVAECAGNNNYARLTTHARLEEVHLYMAIHSDIIHTGRPTHTYIHVRTRERQIKLRETETDREP